MKNNEINQNLFTSKSLTTGYITFMAIKNIVVNRFNDINREVT
jgi:hypothetical protein